MSGPTVATPLLGYFRSCGFRAGIPAVSSRQLGVPKLFLRNYFMLCCSKQNAHYNKLHCTLRPNPPYSSSCHCVASQFSRRRHGKLAARLVRPLFAHPNRVCSSGRTERNVDDNFGAAKLCVMIVFGQLAVAIPPPTTHAATQCVPLLMYI